ncbi:MAG: hypothetical protein M3P51_09670 [Chloroflexota bacterium]|nr:hypothetical protein [Chloroflexota bacterium]
MGTGLDGECDQRVEELERWFGSLPEGVAEMEVIAPHPAYPVWVQIRPLLEPHAAAIGVGFVADVFDVHAGYGAWDYNKCSDDSAVDYCRAISSGGMTEVEQLWRGRVVNVRRELRMDGGVQRMSHAPGCGCLFQPLRWLFGGKQERVIRYPPYY